MKRLIDWHRKTRTGQAEVDYLYQQEQSAIPIEVKSGKGTTLKSLHLFLETHRKSPYGIKFSTHNFSQRAALHSYPLYAIATSMLGSNAELRSTLEYLVQ